MKKLILTAILLLFLTIQFAEAKPSFNQNIDELKNISMSNALAHNWSIKYNCRNFAWDLSQSLTKEGYQVKIVKGRWLYLNGTTCDDFDYKHFRCKHEWVEVKINNFWQPIETTRGYLINPKDFKEHYKK